MRTHLRADEEERVVQDYLAGERGVALAVKHGIGNTTLYRLLRRRGLVQAKPQKAGRPTRGRKKVYGPEFVERLLALHTQDPKRSAGELAGELGCSPHTVLHYLRQNGIKLGGHHRTLTDVELREVVLMYTDGGLSQQAIADIKGVSQITVSRALRSLSVETRGQRGENNHRWKGGRVNYARDYAAVHVEPGSPFAPMCNTAGYVLEHRLVMAEHLGRCLTKDESVHHINGNRKDNRLENLQLRQGQHGKGTAAVCLDCGSRNVGHRRLD